VVTKTHTYYTIIGKKTEIIKNKLNLSSIKDRYNSWKPQLREYLVVWFFDPETKAGNELKGINQTAVI